MSMPHPQSYGLSVPYGTTLLRLGSDPTRARRILEECGAEITGTHLDRTRAIAHIIATPLEKLLNAPEGVAGHNWGMGQFEMAQIYTMFCSSGRTIYDFDPRLTSAFARSDLGDTRVEDIKLPGNSFYLRFRTEAKIIMADGRELDGCYVFSGMDGKFIGLLLVPVREGWPDFGDVGSSGDIETVPGSALLSDAVDAGLAKMEAQFNQMARTVGFEPHQVGLPGLDALRHGHETVKEMLNLVCNALLFLSAYPEEVEAEWPADAPAELVKKATTGHYKQARDAARELWDLGYTKTHFVGRKRAADLRSTIAHGERQSPEGHWRRGHWRRQPYGPERSLRRPKWMLPMWIGDKDVGPHPLRGRIILVDPPEG